MEFLSFEIDTDLGEICIEVECCVFDGQLIIERVTSGTGADISDLFDDSKLYDLVDEYLRDCGDYN